MNLKKSTRQKQRKMAKLPSLEAENLSPAPAPRLSFHQKKSLNSVLSEEPKLYCSAGAQLFKNVTQSWPTVSVLRSFKNAK